MILPAFQPHAYLGLHSLAKRSEKVIRVWRPGAEQCHIELFGKLQEMVRYHHKGIFELIVPEHTQPHDYRVWHSNGLLDHDPYAMMPTLGPVDEYLFSKGVHYELYEKMGGRLCTHQGIEGVRFSVWAPSARNVSLVGDFNFWDGRINPMRLLGASGIWEIFIPGLKEGQKYKFEVRSANKDVVLKADPFALAAELRPNNASIIANLDHFTWTDANWHKDRRIADRPMLIYEIHLGSWRRNPDNSFMNYRQIADQLVEYCQDMGFTHIELLPIAEHPLDESWGYQVTGFFAPTSRFGTPLDFQYFVNTLHANNIGVILDWVPAHFPKDQWGLARFDGTCLYEHADERQGYHPHWHTAIFNYGRNEVSNFLIASALFWLKKMHIDALRVDAVASMLYLDYGRDNGQWIPNEYGTKENLKAIEFMKHLNSVVHKECPTALMIAEESTSFSGITHALDQGGLGFDLKWNMGWMNDTLAYMKLDPIHRAYHQNELTFSLIYAFTERFCLVLSHDEVVHGKGSLLEKMPGDCWQKFANFRLLYSYMLCHPGKKLLFMGSEWAQGHEWDSKNALDWAQLNVSWHKEAHRCVADLNHFYLEQPALWDNDFFWTGFEWVDFSDAHNSVIAYLRRTQSGDTLLCVHNFTPQSFQEYALPIRAMLYECFNTDARQFGGSGLIKRPVRYTANKAIIALAPLATQIYRITPR